MIADELQGVMMNLRRMESGDNYKFQQSIMTPDGPDSKVGAYGIVLSKWDALAEAAGYAGANWRDPTAQDAVVSARIKRDIDAYSKDPEATHDPMQMAALSFKYGTKTVNWLVENTRTDPDAISQVKGLEKVAEYLRSVTSDTPEQQAWQKWSGTGSPRKRSDEQNTSGEGQTLVKAEARIRDALVSIRKKQRAAPPEVDPTQNSEVV